MKWLPPPTTKIYEALGAVADDRIEISRTIGKVYSSSRNKYYDVAYDPEKQEIMTNDNGSYWKGYLGYPAIAFLMKIGVLSYDSSFGNLLKGVPWKDINQQFKNDFEKALEYILSSKSEKEKKLMHDFVIKVEEEIKKLDLGFSGKKVKPPAGY